MRGDGGGDGPGDGGSESVGNCSNDMYGDYGTIGSMIVGISVGVGFDHGYNGSRDGDMLVMVVVMAQGMMVVMAQGMVVGMIEVIVVMRGMVIMVVMVV